MMSARDDIRAYWNDKLVTVSEESLQAFRLPNETWSMLTSVGLPVDERLDRYTGLGIGFRPGNVRSLAYKEERYIAVGLLKPVHDYLETPGVILCLDERSGRVFVIKGAAKYGSPLQFVNTDLEKLLLFLKACIIAKPRMRELAYEIDDLVHRRVTKRELEESGRSLDPRREYDQILNNLRFEFFGIDEEALSNTNHYWPRVLFDWSI
jgi:hypothetical protein